MSKSYKSRSNKHQNSVSINKDDLKSNTGLGEVKLNVSDINVSNTLIVKKKTSIKVGKSVTVEMEEQKGNVIKKGEVNKSIPNKNNQGPLKQMMVNTRSMDPIEICSCLINIDGVFKDKYCDEVKIDQHFGSLPFVVHSGCCFRSIVSRNAPLSIEGTGLGLQTTLMGCMNLSPLWLTTYNNDLLSESDLIIMRVCLRNKENLCFQPQNVVRDVKKDSFRHASFCSSYKFEQENLNYLETRTKAEVFKMRSERIAKTIKLQLRSSQLLYFFIPAVKCYLMTFSLSDLLSLVFDCPVLIKCDWYVKREMKKNLLSLYGPRIDSDVDTDLQKELDLQPKCC